MVKISYFCECGTVLNGKLSNETIMKEGFQNWVIDRETFVGIDQMVGKMFDTGDVGDATYKVSRCGEAWWEAIHEAVFGWLDRGHWNNQRQIPCRMMDMVDIELLE
mgnify:CR=1 FL=1